MENICRIRLFGSAVESPMPMTPTAAFRVMTPCGVGDNSFSWTGNSGLAMDAEQVETGNLCFSSGKRSSVNLDDSFSAFQMASKKKTSRRSLDIRRSLFNKKRSADSDDIEAYSPAAKKFRDFNSSDSISSLCLSASPATTDKDNRIISAVDRLTSEADLVADGSRAHCLPTMPGKHSDLRCISTDTMSAVLNGCYNNIGKVTVIDCRYPYEYDGGHIQGALNLYSRQAIQEFLLEHSFSTDRHVLIFHCEFSSERGPKMYRFLRSLDRDMNKEHYPRLHFPEIYLLEGGYKAFFHQHQTLCHPMSYKPMLHEDHAADLRHFRVKSKSWAAGDKCPGKRRSRTRITIPF